MGKDEFFEARMPGQEIPVNPSPHPFYLTKDLSVYNKMMRAIYTHLKECAESQGRMYVEILKQIPEG